VSLPGFDYRSLFVNGVTINAALKGAGRPLLLLHGYPETHHMWRFVAPALAGQFSIVCPDLRGYGDSGKPGGSADHATYSKRTMARDMLDLMAALGHERFMVAGHDRGGRVAYRLALDHPQAVSRLALLDIVSTKAVYEHGGMALASAYFHWYFLIQPQPLPEALISREPGLWLNGFFRRLTSDPSLIGDADLQEYLRSFATAECVHATCEDYRAGATIDLACDRADVAAGRTIRCQNLILWGARSVVGRLFRPLEAWRDLIETPGGEAVDCGHFIPEERPEETLRLLSRFFAAGGGPC
jgi:haloacetate dehalogenase